MKVTGVYWMGPVFDMGGYGNVSRNYLRAIETTGIPVYIHPVGADHPEIGDKTKRWLHQLSTTKLGDRVVFVNHGLPPVFKSGTYPKAIRNIGVTLFETDRLPEGWAAMANQMDELWVPSQFNYETFSRSGVHSAKIKVVPYPIEVTKYYPGRPYSRYVFSPPARSFVFLYVFGFDYRKGYNLLIRAFCEEFSRDEDVTLLLKVYLHSGINRSEAIAEITSCIPKDRHPSQIILITESFNEQNLIHLYQSADAYVSMDRASGWGMPAMEMMALGKPVAAIRWGGSLQFMNESNSFLIETEDRLEPVDEKLQWARPELYRNHLWAAVHVGAVRKALRDMVQNKERRGRVARKAASDIHLKYSPGAIGMIIQKLLS